MKIGFVSPQKRTRPDLDLSEATIRQSDANHQTKLACVCIHTSPTRPPPSLQDLACAVMGNLLCDPDMTEKAEPAEEQLAEFDLAEGRAADKLLVGYTQNPMWRCTTVIVGSLRRGAIDYVQRKHTCCGSTTICAHGYVCYPNAAVHFDDPS